MSTFRNTSEETLYAAQRAGRITREERQKVLSLWAENDAYKRDPLKKTEPGYLQRETEAAEIYRRALD